MTDAELVRLLGVLADALEPTRSAGLVRLAARRIATATPDPEPDRCPCGAAIVQPETGRRRRWCSARCRRAAHATKRGRKSTMES